MERERPSFPTLLVVAGPLADGEAQEKVLARVAATALRALRDGRGVVLFADGETTTVSRPIDALDWFAGLDPSSPPAGGELRSALQVAGSGAVIMWLGRGDTPDGVAVAARSAGAGALVSAASVAVAER
jgi:hypothetical protein